MMRSDMKKEMQGKSVKTGTTSKPGPVATKAPADLKASPRKKLAMGAKGVVKGY